MQIPGNEFRLRDSNKMITKSILPPFKIHSAAESYFMQISIQPQNRKAIERQQERRAAKVLIENRFNEILIFRKFTHLLPCGWQRRRWPNSYLPQDALEHFHC